MRVKGGYKEKKERTIGSEAVEREVISCERKNQEC